MTDKNQNGRSALVVGLCAALLIVLSLAAYRPLIEGSAQRRAKAPARERSEGRTRGRAGEKERERAKDESPPSDADEGRRENTTPRVSTDDTVSKSSAASDLANNIDRAINESEFASARWGIYVGSLRDGRVLYARNADRPITPASNMKVYTTAVALDLLGADYRWRTSVYAASAPDAGGTIAGDIILYGRGAPDFASETKRGRTASLGQLADDLYARGVRRVRGQVIGDESYFRGEALGDGWLWNDVQ
ncbi:MAG TPA: D-alanyl-D-alanine carboxypeptidase, partial [Pyrinomonadaceae bacterium]|nr:D-alanyl-D-alanine carboxypeptidase [Pyrinomonadaceae bacterium]